MTRHPTARRVHREAAPDDEFVARVLETGAWAKQHRRKLIIGGTVLAVVVIGLVWFVLSRQSRNAQAAAELTQARALALSGNAPLAIRELEQYLSRWDGTRSADEARLMLGRAYMETGQFMQAREAVAPLAGDVESSLGLNAALLTAHTYEAGQEPHRAEEIYLRVAENARFLFQQQDALDNAARIRLQRGDAAGAVTLYERLLELTPASNTERPVFELRLGEARALAALGNTTADAVPAAAAPATPSPTDTSTGTPAAQPAPTTTTGD